jgi:hypothetical protein
VELSETQPAQATLALRPDVVATVLDDGAILLDLESKYFYALNASGWALVQLLESGATASDVERRSKEWGAPADGSVAGFIARLQEYGLLETCDGGGDLAAAVDDPPRPWMAPTVEQQAEPLQHVIVSAFDPSVPLAE